MALMKKLFTRYLFLLFIFPVFIVLILFIFSSSGTGAGWYGWNRTIKFGLMDEVFENPVYNASAFILTYPAYFLGYSVVFLIRRITDFHYSVIHFIMFAINFILLSVNAENRFLIPLSVICFIFFILNIFKTTKIHQI